MPDKGEQGKAKAGQAPGGDAVYALGVIGAWVYYWQRADTAGERGLAVLKGIVWPAFLVYEAFSALSGRLQTAIGESAKV